MTCNMQSAVDSHFAGTMAPENETQMRRHLPTCASCRARYTKRLFLAKLDPTALAQEERIGRGLGIGPQRKNRTAFVAAAFVLAAAAAIFLLSRLPSETDRFAARGELGAEPASHIRVYRAIGPDIVSVQGVVRPNDELAFAYENGAHLGRLMIFGVDEHGHVYWYHPAWTSEGDDPAAVRINVDGSRHELREAIAHHLDGRVLEIHALFVDGPLTVKQVEAKLAGRVAPLGVLAIDGAVDHVQKLEVLP